MTNSAIPNTTNTFNHIHAKLNKIFQNPNINFFIIMNLILMISCYTFMNTTLKYTISSFLANPIIILLSLILIILIGYYNINIGILILLLLFIALYSSTLFNKNDTTHKSKNKSNSNMIEGFTDDTEGDGGGDDDGDDDDGDGGDGGDSSRSKKITKEDIIKSQNDVKKQIKEDKVKSRTNKINSIKDVLLSSVNKIKDGTENEHKKAILENKQIIYENERKNNKSKFTNINKSKSSNNSIKRKEEFQTIEIRAFDPSSEEDTNLIITKEILQDMLNRIKYNFESNKYLKKYLKHRIEEIVEMNKLVDDDDE